MNTGIVRVMDSLGRVVLPAELRGMMGINIGDALAIYTDNKNIILKKYEPGCIFCNNIEGLIGFRGKMICQGCTQEIQVEVENY